MRTKVSVTTHKVGQAESIWFIGERKRDCSNEPHAVEKDFQYTFPHLNVMHLPAVKNRKKIIERDPCHEHSLSPRMNLSGLVFPVIGADYKAGSKIGMQVYTIVGCSGCSVINQ